jgi:hypothetical protein
MDLSAMKDLYIGSTPVQSAWLGGTKVWERTPAVDIQAIKDAMLLWYDLKRQGATNESMAATPELVNLAYDPDKAHVIDWTQFSTRGDGVQQFSIEITSTTNYWVINQGAYHRTNSIPSFYVEVANLPEGKVINYFYGNGSDERQTYAITYNGLHKLPACKISPNVTTATGFFISNENGQTVADVVGTTITQVNPSLNATCYNFAWNGESGVGSYINFSVNSERGDVEILGTQKWIVKNITQDASMPAEPILVHETNFTGFEKTVTVRVSGINENNTVSVAYTGLSQLLHNGDNTVTFPAKRTDGLMRYIVFSFSRDCTNITLEILPEYPNALVADGVDDYAKVEGLPLLNTTDGYTVIAKRKIISVTNTNYQSFATKEMSNNTGAFIFERIIANSPNTVHIYSFGQLNTLPTNYFDSEIIYQTPNQFNDSTIKSGDGNDNDVLWIASSSYPHYRNVALYSFILFNRTLTEEEINWVKTNLIEGDTEL